MCSKNSGEREAFNRRVQYGIHRYYGREGSISDFVAHLRNPNTDPNGLSIAAEGWSFYTRELDVDGLELLRRYMRGAVYMPDRGTGEAVIFIFANRPITRDEAYGLEFSVGLATPRSVPANIRFLYGMPLSPRGPSSTVVELVGDTVDVDALLHVNACIASVREERARAAELAALKQIATVATSDAKFTELGNVLAAVGLLGKRRDGGAREATCPRGHEATVTLRGRFKCSQRSCDMRTKADVLLAIVEAANV